MRVYRVTRCATTLGKTWYDIDMFGLLEYIRAKGLRNSIKELKKGVSTFNMYKAVERIKNMQQLDMWFYKEMIMSKLNIK
jgi:hypothetical protein